MIALLAAAGFLAAADAAALELHGAYRLLLTLTALLSWPLLLTAAAHRSAGRRVERLRADLLAFAVVAAGVLLMTAALFVGAVGQRLTTRSVLLALNVLLVAAGTAIAVGRYRARRRPDLIEPADVGGHSVPSSGGWLAATGRVGVGALGLVGIAVIMTAALGGDYTSRLLPGPPAPAVYLSQQQPTGLSAANPSVVVANPRPLEVNYAISVGGRQVLAGTVKGEGQQVVPLNADSACGSRAQVTVTDPETGAQLAQLALSLPAGAAPCP